MPAGIGYGKKMVQVMGTKDPKKKSKKKGALARMAEEMSGRGGKRFVKSGGSK